MWSVWLRVHVGGLTRTNRQTGMRDVERRVCGYVLVCETCSEEVISDGSADACTGSVDAISAGQTGARAVDRLARRAAGPAGRHRDRADAPPVRGRRAVAAVPRGRLGPSLDWRCARMGWPAPPTSGPTACTVAALEIELTPALNDTVAGGSWSSRQCVAWDGCSFRGCEGCHGAARHQRADRHARAGRRDWLRLPRPMPSLKPGCWWPWTDQLRHCGTVHKSSHDEAASRSPARRHRFPRPWTAAGASCRHPGKAPVTAATGSKASSSDVTSCYSTHPTAGATPEGYLTLN